MSKASMIHQELKDINVNHRHYLEEIDLDEMAVFYDSSQGIPRPRKPHHITKADRLRFGSHPQKK